jgi:HSP20 family protein
MVERLFETTDDSFLRTEEYQDGTTLVVRAEAPGIDPEKDVDISVQNGRLHISARREERSEHKEKDSYRSEFRYGSFERTVPLPAGATEDDVTATYNDGVLEIRVPVGPELPPTSRKVQVTRS